MKEIKWPQLKVGDIVVLNYKKEITYQVKLVTLDLGMVWLKRLTSIPDGFYPTKLSEPIGFFIGPNANTVHLVINSMEPMKRLEPFTF